MTTGSEILFNTLESLSEGEATAMLVVWADENGTLNMRTSCANSHAIGLAEYAKHNLLQGILNGE